jgi:glutaredoxin-like protein
MIDAKTQARAKELLGTLDTPVRLITFTQQTACTYCQQNEELVQDIARLSDQISVELHQFEENPELNRQYGVDKIPAIVIATGDEDFGIRFFGIPSGYEFVSLLEAIRLVSTGKHELSDETVSMIQGIDVPMHIQVFVTPTCPYCQKSVILAHRFAFLTKQITSDMVEAIEFPHLAQRYEVSGVPRSVINENHFIEGAVPEKDFALRIVEAAGGKAQ